MPRPQKQKIVLYNPNVVFFTMPLSLVALGSMLDPERYEVQIIDGRLERDPLASVLAALDGALCLGVTVLTGAPIRDALQISRAAKARFPNLPVIWGGWYASLFPTDTLAEPSIDLTVQGQGEYTFAEIVERLASGSDLHGIAGTSIRLHGHPHQNPARVMAQINDLPPANYDLIPVERYFTLKSQRQFDYISSVGCFFRCAFCADPFVYKRRWAGIDPERMGAEIEQHWRRYRFEELALQDETFFTYRERALAVAEQFLQRGLKLSWTATMRADQGCRMSEEDFALCARSGLRRVMIGVESGSQEMMDWMQKDIKVEQVIESAEKCIRHGIGVIFPFIVGFPGESDESVLATLRMVKRLRSMSPKFETPMFYFKPYPGSRITQEVVNQGLWIG
ncbi:MAG: hypothetical protein Fur005_33640 [Roseiflexaceae bacterium]